MMNLNSSSLSISCHPMLASSYLLSNQHRLISSHLLFKKGGRFAVSRSRRVYCDSQTNHVQTRKYAPVLESEIVSGNEVLPYNEWKTVPDIWRSSAEKFGDHVALVDPYHDPPTNMTYKQLEQEILNFCEGLRVIGLNPEEKLALFADNSCRWLVSDQGIMATGAINVVRGTRSSVEELLQIYNHSERFKKYRFRDHQIGNTLSFSYSFSFIGTTN